MGILNEYKGSAVHDGWLPYFLFACAHALCNVHHIRELVAAFENFQQSWLVGALMLMTASPDPLDAPGGAGNSPETPLVPESSSV